MEGENQIPLNQEVPRESAKPNTTMAIIAYILFFVPLLTDAKNDPFVKYHVKQGLVLFLAQVANTALFRLSLNLLGFLSLGLFGFLSWGINIAIFVLFIMGILNAANGNRKPLPLIGQFAEKFNF